jgi:hypothetical protein
MFAGEIGAYLRKANRKVFESDYFLPPDRVTKFCAWAGNELVRFNGFSTSSHAFSRAAQALLMERFVIKRAKGAEDVLVIFSTWAESVQLFAALSAESRIRFLIGDVDAKDETRIAAGKCRATIEAKKGDLFAQDFLDCLKFGTSKFFTKVKTIKDFPMIRYDLFIAVDSLYWLSPHKLLKWCHRTNTRRGVFTMHMAAELYGKGFDKWPFVRNPVFHTAWERKSSLCGMDMSHMIFKETKDESIGYACPSFIHEAWSNHVTVQYQGAQAFWEPLHFADGYGAFEWGVTNNAGIFPFRRFFSARDTVCRFIDPFEWAIYGKYVYYIADRYKIQDCLLFALANIKEMDPDKFFQNVRSRLDKVAIGNKVLAYTWDLMEVDPIKIVHFLIFMASLMKAENGMLMKMIGGIMRNKGYLGKWYKQPFLWFGARTKRSIKNVLGFRKSTLELFRAIYEVKQIECVEVLHNRVLEEGFVAHVECEPYSIFKRTYDDISILRDLPLAMDDYKAHVGYHRDTIEGMTHAAAKLSTMLPQNLEKKAFMYGVEPGGMLKLMVAQGWKVQALVLKTKVDSYKEMAVDIYDASALPGAILPEYIYHTGDFESYVARMNYRHMPHSFMLSDMIRDANFTCIHNSARLLNHLKYFNTRHEGVKFWLVKCIIRSPEDVLYTLERAGEHGVKRKWNFFSPVASSPFSFEIYLLGKRTKSILWKPAKVNKLRPALDTFYANRRKFWKQFEMWYHTQWEPTHPIVVPPTPALALEETIVDYDYDDGSEGSSESPILDEAELLKEIAVLEAELATTRGEIILPMEEGEDKAKSWLATHPGEFDELPTASIREAGEKYDPIFVEIKPDRAHDGKSSVDAEAVIEDFYDTKELERRLASLYEDSPRDFYIPLSLVNMLCPLLLLQ